ncbi:hypothetical protein LPB72_02185 [Hydrogenophaga crassostreae]|uniref:T6SS Phospholipase effector Tle1-like catalytic domain-containing protein n=1 Tax=Hydrogenophaga crassostreae TaxID=1763535 RepID=A0A162W4N4_9BURK|nr:DUF2235 domain-containing protein [Hydrogenophaga crassostreae]AOW11897.1 hypothetical protein LPB072_02460 [Hydrogenophaga crassostreae]OAD43845.1 hypothetical protein LPB72_02185 [Hydrogenophaga crassostreae]
MTEIVKRLSPAETAAMSLQADKIAATPSPHVDTMSGKQLVFVAHFDGTNNDKDNVKLSGSAQWTNVAQLSKQMEVESKRNENFSSNYYRGVGTDPGLEGTLEASIRPSGDMRETALLAYTDFQKQATDWLKQHPDANSTESLKVLATGFSRGAGTAAVFSQMLHERGLTDPATGMVIVPPGQLGLAGAMVFDPVTTGFDRNSAFSPESKSITVVQAKNEYRVPFKGVDHSGHPGASVVPVTGNHCDIGGGYDNGIAARVLESSTAWMKKSGLPIAEVPPERRFDGSAAVHHERDLPKTAEAAQASRSTWARAIFPIGSRLVEGAASVADYPVTHDPKNGLNQPRQLTQSASEETRLASGWRRFEAAEATVWRKDFPSPGGGMVKASLVEPYLKPGMNQRPLSMQLQSVRSDGSTTQHPAVKADGQDPGATMRTLDQRLGTGRRQAEGAQSPAPMQSSSASNQTLLHPALQSLQVQLTQRGYTPEQANKISAYAQSGLNPLDAAQLKQAALSNDGQSLALVFRDPPYKGIAIQDALTSQALQSPAANAPFMELATQQQSQHQQQVDAPVLAQARSR